MSMNLENLFSPNVNFYGSQYTQAEYDAKMDWIAGMISSCQVHVAGLVELGDNANQILADLQIRIAVQDPTGWGAFAHHHVAPPGPDGSHIHTAVLSRFPLANQGDLSAFPAGFQVDLYDDHAGAWNAVPLDHFSRPVAHAQVQPPGHRAFNIFVVHLKSKRPSLAAHDNNNEPIGIARSAIKRNIEAAALRYHLDTFLVNQYDNVDAAVPTFLVGDFNDVPTSVPLENIRGPFDPTPGPAANWSNPDKRRLLSCARLHLKMAAYQDKLYSYVHDENFTLIDQVFVTEHLVSRFERMEVYNDHVLRHHEISTNTQQAQQWKSAVSDHGVVVVEFRNLL